MTRQSQMRKSSNRSLALISCGALESTTDLGAIRARKVLVLLDEQNLSISAQNHGYTLDYGQLAERIRSVADQAHLHVFTAADLYDGRKKKHFEKLGYCIHVKMIQYTAMNCNSNIDNLFAFWAGAYSVRTSWEVIVFGSGDYGLSGELSKAVYGQRRRRRIQIMTLSLPGSTAQKLDARRNQHITANLEIGLDLLKPLCASGRHLSARALGSYRVFRSDSFVNPGF